MATYIQKPNHNPQNCNKQKAKAASYPFHNFTFTFSTLPDQLNRKRECPTLIRTLLAPSVGFIDSCVKMRMRIRAIQVYKEMSFDRVNISVAIFNPHWFIFVCSPHLQPSLPQHRKPPQWSWWRTHSWAKRTSIVFLKDSRTKVLLRFYHSLLQSYPSQTSSSPSMDCSMWMFDTWKRTVQCWYQFNLWYVLFLEWCCSPCRGWTGARPSALLWRPPRRSGGRRHSRIICGL